MLTGTQTVHLLRRWLLSLVLAAALAVPSTVLADGSQTLGQTLATVIAGGGVETQGVGMAQRRGGPSTANIIISGVPTGATVNQAFIYWITIGGSGDNTVVFEGYSVTGTEIGQDSNTCWRSARGNSCSAKLIWMASKLDGAQGGASANPSMQVRSG